MKNIFLIMIVALLCQGCAGCASRLIDKVPQAEFEKFSYHRGGNVTSASVVAAGSQIKDGVITIDSLEVQENWGPAVNFTITLEGYKREIKGTEQ